MNNKKCKIETSVADLIKPKKKHLYSENLINSNKKKEASTVNDISKKKCYTSELHIKSNKKKCQSTSVNDLVKSPKNLYEPSVTSVTSVTNLIKPIKKYFYPCDCACCKGIEVDSCIRENI